MRQGGWCVICIKAEKLKMMAKLPDFPVKVFVNANPETQIIGGIETTKLDL